MEISERRRALGVLVIAASIGLAGMTVACSAEDSINQLAEEQDVDAAIQRFFEYRSGGSAPELLCAELVDSSIELDSSSTLLLISIGDIAVEGDTARALVTWREFYGSSSSGDPDMKTVYLNREAGEWKSCEPMWR